VLFRSSDFLDLRDQLRAPLPLRESERPARACA
jgi:hypothetical protein